jgi:hypothetical protein
MTESNNAVAVAVAAAAAAASSSNSKKEAAASNSNSNSNKKEKSIEFNPRWKGYVFIGLTSLVNFASISNIPRDDRKTYWAATMSFGLLTFVVAVLVLIHDRSQKCLETFHYTKANNGYFEG